MLAQGPLPVQTQDHFGNMAAILPNPSALQVALLPGRSGSRMGPLAVAARLRSEANPPADPLTEGLFERIDGKQRPARVSREAWSEVFPPDYEAVRLGAGLYFLKGADADTAVRLAARDVERRAWSSGHIADVINALADAFPPSGPGGLPALPLLSAALSVQQTAIAAWKQILGAADPPRAAFLHRRWHAPQGCCLVCGGAAFPGAEADFYQNDLIHRRCTGRMRLIGPSWGGLVVAACERECEAAAIRGSAIPDLLPDVGKDQAAFE
jgi:hypothetical protein